MLQVANVAAGIKVGQVGAVPVALSEIIAALHEHEGKILGRGQLAELRQRLAQAGERLVFTNGCFDVLHIGHLRLLERSRQLGDRLLVAVNSDDSVRRLKGPSRPLNREADRAAMLAALDCVDFVTVFEEDTPKEAILKCRPDVLVKGGDYTLDTVVGAAEVQGWGGQVELIPLVAGQSSTRLIESM
jgi:D-beta-D-heptose 7-phosphate kinase/D-beta-D-heptose 1-phosphate adenosyltransferase